MKRRVFYKLAAFCLATVMTISVTVPVTANEARIITIHNMSGDNVELSRGARAATPRQGQRIAQGNVLTTGRASTVYLSMDTASILKMDQKSQVVVSSAGNRLALTVQSGSALLDVGVQQTGQTTEVRIGNTGLAVRGTMFTVSRMGDFGVIHMLSGLGEVGNSLLPAGYSMLITQQANGDIVHIHPMVFEELDGFTLQAISDNADYLSTYGIITQEILDLLPNLKQQAQTRENAIQTGLDRALATAIADITGFSGQTNMPDQTQYIDNTFENEDGMTDTETTPAPLPTNPPPTTPEPDPPDETAPPTPEDTTPPTGPPGQIVSATMSVTSSGGGSGDANWVNMNAAATPVPPIQAIGGDTITIFAGYRPGYVFAGWTTHYTTFAFANPSSPTTTFVMPNEGNAVVNANWSAQ